MSIAENLAHVRATIAAACDRVGRDPSGVTLIAVSKTHPPAAVLEALAAGVQHFGENRVEEAVTKIPAVNAQFSAGAQLAEGVQPPVWHMIGHLQSRKAKDVPPLFRVVHSVDSLKLAERLSRAAIEHGALLDILLEVNVSGEASKAGFAASGWQESEAIQTGLVEQISQLAELPGLNLRGLMTMAPIVDEIEQARPVFASLAELRIILSGALNRPLPDLSMGMTDDYPVAVEEGATLVRIGRAIFGERERL